MRRTLTFISFIFYLNHCLFAQTKLMPGEMSINNRTYKVHLIDPIVINSDTIRLITISNKINKYDNGIPYPKNERFPMHGKDMHVNEFIIKEIAYKALSDNFDTIKNNKESISFGPKFTTNGKLTDLWIGLNANTKISLEEVDRIDTEIRKSITATFTRKEYLQYEAINYFILPFKL